MELAGVVLAAAAAVPARADTVYEVVTFGGAQASDLNDLGQVLLNRGGQAILWEGGGEQVLFNGEGHRLNVAGQVTGRTEAGVGGQALVYLGGATTLLGAGQALAQNELGQVVYRDASGFYLWEGGVLTPFAAGVNAELLANTATITAINDAGMMAGYTASPQGFRLVGETFEFFGNTADDINEAGDLVFHQESGGFWGSAYLARAGGGVVELGSLGDPVDFANDRTFEYAVSVNDIGQVVGVSEGRGALWDFLGNVKDLNSLLRTEDASRWEIVQAYRVNDNGDILALAANRLGPTAGGLETVLLTQTLDPGEIVPEPSSLALALAGLGCAALLARRRAFSGPAAG
jgi:hypothetical protein